MLGFERTIVRAKGSSRRLVRCTRVSLEKLAGSEVSLVMPVLVARPFVWLTDAVRDNNSEKV